MAHSALWRRCLVIAVSIGSAIGAQGAAFTEPPECTPTWSEVPSLDGVEGVPGWAPGTVYALTMFDDGTGPAQYVGGLFFTAGDIDVGGIARWDGQRWSTVGSIGFDAEVYALAVFDDGNGPALYAAGQLGKADGQYAQRIAKWDGHSWAALPPAGTSGVIYALQVFDDGSGPALYVGGLMPPNPGSTDGYIRRWDGGAWSSVGGGMNGIVRAMTVYDDGSGPALYAGGQFSEAGGKPAFGIARWDGEKWSEVGGGFPGSAPQTVRALVGFDDGSGPALYVGATAHEEEHATFVRWKDDEWEILGTGIASTGHSTRVTALTPVRTEDGTVLMVGGYFRHPPPSPNVTAIGMWDGESLKLPTSGGPYGWGTGIHAFLARPRAEGPDALTIGGSFRNFWFGGPSGNAISVRNILEFDGAYWRLFQRGLRSHVYAVTTFDDGSGPSLHAFGSVPIADGTLVHGIARRNSELWEPAMGGVSGVVNAVMLHEDEKSLIVGGSFTLLEDESIQRIAIRRNGRWWPMGEGLNGIVTSVLSYQMHDDTAPVVIVGGAFQLSGTTSVRNIAQWDGSAWHPLGSGLNERVTALATFDDGTGPTLYAGGWFTMAGDVTISYLARWDGARWSEVGGGTNGLVDSLYVFDDGSGAALYVGGDFTRAGETEVNRIARWDGRQWTALGDDIRNEVPSARVHAIGSFDDGSGPALYSARGALNAEGIPRPTIGRWNGQLWTTYVDDLIGTPRVLYQLPESDETGFALFIGGSFLNNHPQFGVGARTLFGCPRSDGICSADLNNDQKVDLEDLVLLLSSWGPCADCAADLNEDDIVDEADLIILIEQWGACAE